MAYGNTAHNNR